MVFFSQKKKKKQKHGCLPRLFFCSRRKFCFFNQSFVVAVPFSGKKFPNSCEVFTQRMQKIDLLMTTGDFGIQVRVRRFRLNLIFNDYLF